MLTIGLVEILPMNALQISVMLGVLPYHQGHVVDVSWAGLPFMMVGTGAQSI